MGHAEGKHDGKMRGDNRRGVLRKVVATGGMSHGQVRVKEIDCEMSFNERS